MKRQHLCIGIVASLTAGAVHAQQATEVYIPVGQSPGVSASESLIGTISAVDHESYEMTVSVEGRSTVVAMTSKTRYYLDRNRDRKVNTTGGLDDCEIGRRVEIKLDVDGKVDWVKVISR